MKRLHPLLLAFLFATIALSLATSRAQTTDSAKTAQPAPSSSALLIVPGKSVGEVHLGDTQQAVRKLLGQPSGMLLMGPFGGETYFYELGLTVYFRSYKVTGIRASSERFQTAQGIGVGSSANFIRSQYKGGTLSPSKIGLTDNMGKVVRYVTSYDYLDSKHEINFHFGPSGNFFEPRRKNSPLFDATGKPLTSRCESVTIMAPENLDTTPIS